MNLALLGPEIVVVGLGLALLLMDLVVPDSRRPLLGAAAAAFTLALCLYMVSLVGRNGAPELAFGGMFIADGLAAFFKALFLLAGTVVLLMSADTAGRPGASVTEYYVLVLFALAGMLLCASANHFAVLYVALELVTVTFYVLTSYQRHRLASLEAGVKYLILGALSSAFMVYGIALCFGAAGTLSFAGITERSAELADNRLFQLGMLLVLGGLTFKIALFPFQVWAPDVYEGAPAPTTAFLAIGSKAAGVVLLVRLLGEVVPELATRWMPLLMGISVVSIFYGSLCAIPQRSLRRLLGYSSIANGGFVLLGVAAFSKAGSAAVLFYLAAYLFAVLAAFLVVAVVVQKVGSDNLGALAGLHRRAPLLAGALTFSMVSLAGVPPLAGFMGKFVILQALVERGADLTLWYGVAAVALIGVVISFWYYFGVLKAVYWPAPAVEGPGLVLSPLLRATLYACLAGMVILGVYPGLVWEAAMAAVQGLRL